MSDCRCPAGPWNEHADGCAVAAARAAKVVALRAYLDEIDEQTRQPGEPPLREAVAQQARERLAEMTVDPCASDSLASVSPEQTPSPAADSAHSGDHSTVGETL